MEKKRANWQDILIACLLTAGGIYALFWVKGLIPRGSGMALAVLVRPLVYGLGAGLVLCAAGIFLMKKGWLSLVLAGILLAAWLLVTPLTGDWAYTLDSALLGCGLACVFVSVPRVAELLALTHIRG